MPPRIHTIDGDFHVSDCTCPADACEDCDYCSHRFPGDECPRAYVPEPVQRAEAA